MDDAAHALANVKGRPEVIEALLGALDDPEDLVRCNSAEALIELLDLPVKENNYGGHDLSIDVMMAEGDERRSKAEAKLRDMVKKKQAKDAKGK
ncbi:MAG: HEAT repeat domain-containing protein [Chloroflexia bacterium]